MTNPKGPKPASSMQFYCAACDARHPDRNTAAAHRRTWRHRAKSTMKAYEAKGWQPVRGDIEAFRRIGIPVEAAPYEDDSNPGKIDQFGRGEFVTYVPKPVADACKDWLALPKDAKKQSLLDYLETMFKAVDWNQHLLDEVNRAALAQKKD